MRSRTRSELYAAPPLAKTKLYMAQVAFHPLPVWQDGEGLEVEENKANDGVTINIINRPNSWTLVQRKKQNRKKKENKSQKWNKQQRENFRNIW
jgi:hypothetical protein